MYWDENFETMSVEAMQEFPIKSTPTKRSNGFMKKFLSIKTN